MVWQCHRLSKCCRVGRRILLEAEADFNLKAITYRSRFIRPQVEAVTISFGTRRTVDFDQCREAVLDEIGTYLAVARAAPKAAQRYLRVGQ